MILELSQDIVYRVTPYHCSFPCSSFGKESACNAGDLGLVPGLGRSPGEENGNPLQYSFLENPMDRGAWQATVPWVTRVGHNLGTKPPPYHWWNHLNQEDRSKCRSQGNLATDCPLGTWFCQPPVIRHSGFPWISCPRYRWNYNYSKAHFTNKMAQNSVGINLNSYRREESFYEWLTKPTIIRG